RFNRRGAHILQYFQVDLRGWGILVCLVAALHQAQYRGPARRGGSATAKLNPSLSGLTVAAFDFTGPPFTARTLVALVSFHLVLQLAARIEMVRVVDATIQQIDTTLRCPLLEDRKSTRLNSSHVAISYAVFCLKKKKRCTLEKYCVSIQMRYV